MVRHAHPLIFMMCPSVQHSLVKHSFCAALFPRQYFTFIFPRFFVHQQAPARTSAPADKTTTSSNFFQDAERTFMASVPPAAGSPSPQPAGTDGASSVSRPRAPAASAATVSFFSLCSMFERILEAKASKATQLSYVELLWRSMAGATAADYHAVLRLMMPQLDTKRAVYGLKESKIARFYIELLGLSDSSPDAVRLKNWKDPSRSSADSTAFSDTVFVMLVKRGFSGTTTGGAPVGVSQQPHHHAGSVAGGGGDTAHPQQSHHHRRFTGMSVLDVNNALDALAAAGTPQTKKAVLFELLRAMCALEHKWLIRLIMKEMRMHLAHGPILGAFHPSALDLFNSTNDLQHVCEQCLDPAALAEAAAAAAASGGGGNKVFLNRPFRPMLASVVASDKLAALLEGERLIVEPKYDGERILLHFDASSTAGVGGGAAGGGGGLDVPTAKVLYWSRNAKNSTHLYAPKFDPVIKGCINWAGGEAWRRGASLAAASSSAAPQASSSFWPGMVPVRSCVLDGELLLYDKERRRYVEFGHNRTFARAGREGRDGDGDGVDGGQSVSAAPSSMLASASLFGGMVVKTDADPDDAVVGRAGGYNYGGGGRRGGGYTSAGAQAILADDGGRYCFQYQIFDIVFLNGECLCATPLERRKELLRRTVKEKTDEVHFVPFAPVRSGEEILKAMDAAIAQRHEGVIIKVAGSHYVPAERKLKWMKLKPDHISGVADTMDFIILGAYYGTKYGQRHLSHFLLGCFVDDAEKGASNPPSVVGSRTNSGTAITAAPAAAAAPAVLGVKRERDEQQQTSAAATSGPTKTTSVLSAAEKYAAFSDRRARFHTVCKVGTGYDAAELKELNAALEGKWITLPPGSASPPWLDGWRPAAGEAPDVYIHPKDSAVMEIFGYSMTETVKFRFGHTVRFPRCNRVRHDKDVEDATTTSQLRAIVAASCSNAHNGNNDGSAPGAPFSGADFLPPSGGGTAQLLASRRAGDLDTFITMKEAKKLRKERGIGESAGISRAKRNLKGEADFYGDGGDDAFDTEDSKKGTFSRKGGLVFASRTIVAPSANSVERLSDLFSGYEVCVLQSSIEVMERTALERLLISHGAQVVSNPQPNTSVVLASSRHHARVQNWINAASAAASSSASPLANFATTDVVSVRWALDSIAAGALLPLSPNNTIHASPPLLSKFRMLLDVYGDPHYEDCASTSDLRGTLRRVVRSGAHRRISAAASAFTAVDGGGNAAATLPIPANANHNGTGANNGAVVDVDGDDAVAATPSPALPSADGGVQQQPRAATPPAHNAAPIPHFLSATAATAVRIAALRRMIRDEFPLVCGEEKGERESAAGSTAGGAEASADGRPLTANTPIPSEGEGPSSALRAALLPFAAPIVALAPRVAFAPPLDAYRSSTAPFMAHCGPSAGVGAPCASVAAAALCHLATGIRGPAPSVAECAMDPRAFAVLLAGARSGAVVIV